MELVLEKRQSIPQPFQLVSLNLDLSNFRYTLFTWNTSLRQDFGLFRRVNLYGLPRVTVFVSGSEIDTSKT